MTGRDVSAVLLAAVVVVVAWQWATSPSSNEKPLYPRTAIYEVTGLGPVDLTYINKSGGTEQITVQLPWRSEFYADQGHYLYLSAQKSQRTGSITAWLYIDGTLAQKAGADSPYGIASVSGMIP